MSFLEHIEKLDDPRIAGMVHYRLDEILLTVLVGLLCRAEDFDEIEDICATRLDWLWRFLPFDNGIAPAQTLRRTLARLNPKPLEAAFSAWVCELCEHVRGVICVDGKSLRASKWQAEGAGALHLVCAYAHQAGLGLTQQAVDGKSNELNRAGFTGEVLSQMLRGLSGLVQDCIEVFLCFIWGDVSDWFQQAAIVEPIDPLQCFPFDLSD